MIEEAGEEKRKVSRAYDSLQTGVQLALVLFLVRRVLARCPRSVREELYLISLQTGSLLKTRELLVTDSHHWKEKCSFAGVTAVMESLSFFFFSAAGALVLLGLFLPLPLLLLLLEVRWVGFFLPLLPAGDLEEADLAMVFLGLEAVLGVGLVLPITAAADFAVAAAGDLVVRCCLFTFLKGGGLASLSRGSNSSMSLRSSAKVRCCLARGGNTAAWQGRSS